MMECFPSHRSTGSILKDRKAEALTVRQLREWHRTRNSPRLEKCAIRCGERTLVPAAGAAQPARNGRGIIGCSFQRSATVAVVVKCDGYASGSLDLLR